MLDFFGRALGAASCAWLAVCLLVTGCSDSSSDSAGNAGKLRADATVLLKTDEQNGHLAVIDAVRDGDTIYVIVNVEYLPTLLVSKDAGVTWTTHALPPSYDKVEGIADLTPGNYALYPWQGQLYMLVAATTYTARVGYRAIAAVNLETNDYSLRKETLSSGPVSFGSGIVLVAKSEGGSPTDGSLAYGNVYWTRYDFSSDTVLARGEVQLAGTNLAPSNWASADGQELVALSGRTPANAPVEVCRVSLDTTTGGNTLTPACLSELRTPLGKPDDTHPVITDKGVAWITALGGHGFLVNLTAGESLTAKAIDLGPGLPVSQNFTMSHPMFGDFFVLQPQGEDAMMSQPKPRLVGFAADGSVQDVELPWTPCEGGETCGYGQPGAYGTVRWILPMNDGEQLVFHVVGKNSNGLPQLLVMTHEHAKLTPATFTPLDLGILPGRPELKPAPIAVQQCARAVGCGYHTNMPGCEQYWSVVRHGPAGNDDLYEAFLAVPAGDCELFQDVYTDIHNPKGQAKPCEPGCDGDWATFVCNYPVRLNCAARGVPCRVDAMGRGYCADRDLTPANCNTCDGDVAINCDDNPMPSMTDCGLNHLKCQVLAEAPNPSRAVCSPGPCPSANNSSCVGEVETYCWQSNPVIVSEVDCSRMNERSKCADAGPCVVYGENQLCVDGLMIYGNGENSRFVDCKTLGFSGCIARPDGAPGLDQVSCVP